MPTAIVIGAGIGGLAAAGRLVRAGYKTTVVEKSAAPGGRASQVEQGKYRFDGGPTLFLMPQVFKDTYAALGERMEDHLDLTRLGPLPGDPVVHRAARYGCVQSPCTPLGLAKGEAPARRLAEGKVVKIRRLE